MHIFLFVFHSQISQRLFFSPSPIYFSSVFRELLTHREQFQQEEREEKNIVDLNLEASHEGSKWACGEIRNEKNIKKNV